MESTSVTSYSKRTNTNKRTVFADSLAILITRLTSIGNRPSTNCANCVATIYFNPTIVCERTRGQNLNENSARHAHENTPQRVQLE